MRYWLNERTAMVRPLRDAGPGTVMSHVALLLASAALPTVSALATEFVLARSGHGDVTAPLVLFGAILLVGQAAAKSDEVLVYRIRARINGAHRTRVATLLSAGQSVEELEDSEVRDLVRAATADPRDWIEKTPGDGALAVLGTTVRCLGLLMSLAVVAAWSGLLVVPLAVAVLAVRLVTSRHWRAHYRVWSGNLLDSRRYLYWGGLTASASAGKESRVFGFGPWLIGRHQHSMHQHLDPVWADDRRAAKAWTVRIVVTAVALTLVYGLVARAANGGSHSVPAAAGVFAAAWSAFTVLGMNGPVIDIQGARPVLRATAELTERLLSGYFDGRPTTAPS